MKKILCKGKFKQFVIQDGWEFVERVNCWGIVAILAMTDERKVVLVEQFRIPVGKKVIEFPAGLADGVNGNSEETLEEAAKRELLEETGYEAARMTLCLRGPISPAANAEIMHLFRAEGLKKISKGGGDGTESIIVHETPLAEIDKWLCKKEKEGILIDSKVYAGLYLLTRNPPRHL